MSESRRRAAAIATAAIAAVASPALAAAVALSALSATVALSAPATASATQVASINAKLSPLKPRAHAALTIGFEIRTLDGSLPSALTGLVFHYPKSLGVGSSELGLASCNPRALQVRGPKACPPDSIMGRGAALAKFQVGPGISEEHASIALVAGPSSNGYVKMLVSATGVFPVDARIVMRTLLLPGRLRFSVPLVPGIPEGPDVAVVRVKATIGGRLTYYTRRKGRRIAYHPQGILLPPHCPRGGFHFSANFSFLDGTTATARTRVRCRHGASHARLAAARSRGRDPGMRSA